MDLFFDLKMKKNCDIVWTYYCILPRDYVTWDASFVTQKGSARAWEPFPDMCFLIGPS